MSYILKELCLEITNACTMECRHCSTCSIKFGQNTCQYMPFSIIKNVIADFASGHGKILEISGGEPLTHPDLENIIRLASSLNLEVRLYTSGISANRNNCLSHVSPIEMQELKALGLNKIIFNLEGYTPKIHERITGVIGSHHLATKSINSALTAGIWTGIHFVPMKPNFHELPNIIDYCSQIGVRELALLRFVPQGRGATNRTILELSYEELHNLLIEIPSLRRDYPSLKIRVGCPLDFLSLYDDSIKPHICKAGKSTCVIAPTGDVMPCPGFKNAKGFIAGNIYQRSLQEIWQKEFSLLRRLSLANLTGPCSACEDIKKCFGRCSAQRLWANGDIFLGPDPACPKLLAHAPATSQMKELEIIASSH